MKLKLFFLFSLLCISRITSAVPFIEEIHNNTHFVFDIVTHESHSPCGLFEGDINLYRIYPQDTFKESIIMHFGDKLVLRPVGYFDSRQQEFIWFVDRNGVQHDDRVEEAYEACLYNRDVYRFWDKRIG